MCRYGDVVVCEAHVKAYRIGARKDQRPRALSATSTTGPTTHPPLLHRALLSWHSAVWVLVCRAAPRVQRRLSNSLESFREICPPQLASPLPSSPPPSLNPTPHAQTPPRQDLPSHDLNKGGESVGVDAACSCVWWSWLCENERLRWWRRADERESMMRIDQLPARCNMPWLIHRVFLSIIPTKYSTTTTQGI